MQISSRKTLSLLLPLSVLLGACDAQAPIAPTSDTHSDRLSIKTGGLFRIESPMFPFYARAEPPADVGGFGYHTDDWAAIVFYRAPSCVPGDFNLFQFIDFDFGRVFSCPTTVDGFALHVEGQGVTPPKMSNLNGNAVPIWFIPWDTEFQQAVANGSLTTTQLEAMNGLVKGVATQFREVLNSIENHPVPKINITARGYILPESGGGSFSYNVNWPGLTVDDVKNVNIVIKQ
ncbi:MAG TPA: hypothetical protein VM939_02545 [Gemmatimonadaceae bacterium]|nr:hypothetical protein [Gemmatimonadaceae bacterium]